MRSFFFEILGEPFAAPRKSDAVGQNTESVWVSVMLRTFKKGHV
jgi:hypothetical protein